MDGDSTKIEVYVKEGPRPKPATSAQRCGRERGEGGEGKGSMIGREGQQGCATVCSTEMTTLFVPPPGVSSKKRKLQYATAPHPPRPSPPSPTPFRVRFRFSPACLTSTQDAPDRERKKKRKAFEKKVKS